MLACLRIGASSALPAQPHQRGLLPGAWRPEDIHEPAAFKGKPQHEGHKKLKHRTKLVSHTKAGKPASENLGPPMGDLLWTVLSPPVHNKLRTVPPDTDSAKQEANAMDSAKLYEAIELGSEAANFTVLDLGSREGGLSLKVARKHESSTVISVALARNEEEQKIRRNQTSAQLWLGGELGTSSNNFICTPPISASPAMLVWWLHRQPVLFDYLVIRAHALEILAEDLLPHELEAVMARALQLAKVVVIEEPDTSSTRKYMAHWGTTKIESLLRTAAKLGHATDISIKKR